MMQWDLEVWRAKNSHKMECQILEKSVENQVWLTEKFYLNARIVSKFCLIDIFFPPSLPPVV